MRSKKPSNKQGSSVKNPFQRLAPEQYEEARKGSAHVYGKGCRCHTDSLGFANPKNVSPLRLVLDSSEGFIPLWAKDVTLRWRFNERSLRQFSDIESAKNSIRTTMAKALLAWGSAVPIRFVERSDATDFEVSVRNADDCDINGCVLASAFFPSAGPQELLIYPKMLEQSEKEQVETLAHEFGHVFGLRHFFAKVSEKAWPSVTFGKHKAFSIMNYGSKSILTAADKSDLTKLYASAWAGTLTKVNGTPIKLVRPAHG